MDSGFEFELTNPEQAMRITGRLGSFQITLLITLSLVLLATKAIGQGRFLWESNGAGNSIQPAIALSDCGIAVATNYGELFRISASGDTLWHTQFDSISNSNHNYSSLLSENESGELTVVYEVLSWHHSSEDRGGSYSVSKYAFRKYDRDGHCLIRKGLDFGDVGAPTRLLELDSAIVVVCSKFDRFGSGDVIGIGHGGDLTVTKISNSGNIVWSKNYRFPTGQTSLMSGRGEYCGAYFGLIEKSQQICLLVDVVDVEAIDDLANSGRYFDPNSDTRPRRLRYGDKRQDTLNFQMITLDPDHGADTTIWIHNLKDFFELPLNGEIVLNRWPFDRLIKNGREGIFAGIYTPRRLNRTVMAWEDDPQRFQIYRLMKDFHVTKIADFELKLLATGSRKLDVNITAQSAHDPATFILAGKMMLADTSRWANTAFVEQVSAKGEDWIWHYGKKYYQEEPFGIVLTPKHLFLLGTRDNPPDLDIPEHQNWIVKLAY